MAEIQTIGVVGSGAMGAGIAQVGLAAGLRVILYDVDRAALARARSEILARLARQVEKGQLPQGFAAEADDRLRLADALEDFAPAQAVIEAIVERLEPKQALFRALEAAVSPDALLATNTSSLSVAAIAAGCVGKARICGLHFFNPVPLMNLVEVVVAPATSEAAAATASELSRRLGKTPVRVKDGPGFLVNLAGRAYATEALHVAQEGVADAATIDRIMRDGAGFRMGPFELMDLTGIDVNFPATSFIYQGYQHDPRIKTTSLHELMFNAGRYGRKSGQGFYAYGEAGAAAVPAACEAPPAAGAPFAATLGEPGDGVGQLSALGLCEGDGPVLIAPVGEDAATACCRLGLDPTNVVALDLTALDRKHVTVTVPLGGDAGAADAVADWLRGWGCRVEKIKDSPGFVLQRMLAMVANLGCELAQIGIGTPEDIDTAMRLAQNYPRGPLEWAEHLGPTRVLRVLQQMQEITGSDRYRPSLWLRRRAMLGLPIHRQD